MWQLAVYERSNRQTPIAVLADAPNALPAPGARLTLAGHAEGYVVVEYALRLDATAAHGEVAVIVEPDRRHWFERLDDDRRQLVAATLVVLTVVLGGFVALLSYFDPLQFRAWLGWAARPVVGFGLVAAGSLVTIRLPGWTRGKPTLLGWYLGLLCPVIGLILAFAWADLSRPAAPLVAWPDDYARHFDALTTHLATLVPTVLVVVPGLLLFLKWVGLEAVGKIVDLAANHLKGRSRSGS